MGSNHLQDNRVRKDKFASETLIELRRKTSVFLGVLSPELRLSISLVFERTKMSSTVEK